MVGIIEVRKFDTRPGLDRQERRCEGEILLCNLLWARCSFARESAFDVDYGLRWIGGKNTALTHDLISFRRDRRELRMR
jgi:hypothetical protein